MLRLADPLFLGFLPSWIGDLLSILGAPAILLAIVVYVLGRKQANRKLIVDEGTLKRSEFETFTTAQSKALEEAREETKDAKSEASSANDRLDVMDNLYDQMRDSILTLRAFVRKIAAKTNYEMSPEEVKEFELTKPPPRPPRIRA